MKNRKLLLPISALLLVTPAAAEPRFGLPLKCEFGQECFVQNFVDHDAGPGRRDFKCGARTYDSHNGTDFRVADDVLRLQGVDVLALTDGTVLRGRDGVDDISVRVGGLTRIQNIQCGNGVVIDHGEGWTAQYCHMAKGSIRVKPGDRVLRGQTIGAVGLSGNTEFAHLHVTVRYQDKIVDPYAFGADPNTCNGGYSLWDPSVESSVRYREGEVINVGFTDRLPSMDTIESGEVQQHRATATSDMIIYARAIGLNAGDQQILRLEGPPGFQLLEQKSPPLEADRAQQFLSAGRKANGRTWPSGQYKASYRVMRQDKPVVAREFEITLP